MGSNAGGKDTMLCENNENSETTVEIKIKTLDSQTYTLRVDKSVPVPALKEQIATVTGVLSDQQRLICRGKVLKDDQLLSAYHVEDGHTLHLVVRQPIPPRSESSADHPATDPASSNEHSQANQAGPSVVVGTFNISEQGDGGFPDFGRIVSAVLGSLVIPSTGSGSDAAGVPESFSERLSRIPGLGGFRISSVRQADDTTTRNQSNPDNDTFPSPADVPPEILQPPVIPDSLATLSQYLSHMRQEFSGNARGQVIGSHGSNGQDSTRFGLPTPSSLAEVTASTRQLLVEQAAECLMQLTRQLEDQANVTDPLGRTRIQSNALRSGALLQNLGAFLLELGRTTMTLRMGQVPADAVVNAGPAVFISTSGPNPIMVQPLPFQPGTSFGAAPVGNVQPSPGPSVGSGFRPSNVDIRIIRTGSLRSTSVNQREPTAGDTLGQNDPAASGSGNAAHQAATRNSSSTRESEVRVLPVRTVVTTIPLGRALSDSSRGSLGILHQVLGRSQHADVGNGNSSGQASEGSHPQSVENERQPNPDYQDQNHRIPSVNGTIHGQRVSTDSHSGLDQFIRAIFPGEQSHGNGFNYQEMGANSVSSNVESTRVASNSQEAAPGVGDEGTFLSNLLRQIIPIVSQNAGETNESSQHGSDFAHRNNGVSSTEDNENPDRGTTSQRSGDSPPSPPSSKRQKRE